MVDNKDDVKMPKLKDMSRSKQIIFVGILAGALFVGVYLVGMGILQATTPPVILSNGKITSDNPLSFQYSIRSGTTEMEIYNDAAWNVNSVWIGSNEEYDAYHKGGLVTGVQHVFNGPFTVPKLFDYKFQPLYNNLIIETNNNKNQVKNYTMTISGIGTDSKATIMENTNGV